MPHLTPSLKALAAASLLCAAALPAGAQATITVDATSVVRVVDNRQFGLNTPFWDGSFTDANTLSDEQQMGTTIMRFGGGSATDEYNWKTNTDIVSGDTWAFNIDEFAVRAKAINAQAIITTNYGSAQASDAAAYVTYANITHGYGFKYWEIGNECYGTWEYDLNTAPHDGYTYATRAVQYIQAMKAADPTIKVGAVIPYGEDSYVNSNTTHSVTNPRTNVSHFGFGPVMLATFKAAGVYPDFLIYHRYEQNPGQENDLVLLQDALTWPQDAASLRQEVSDYIGGSAGAAIELLVTENNSVSSSPGKQSVSLVNGLYLADSTANLMQTEFNALTWWDLHNGQGFNSTTAPINISSSLYGWRIYGDYGVEFEQTGDFYPTFYIEKLLTHFARGGDSVVKTVSSNPLLSAYAVKRVDGTLSVLVINKSPTATTTGNFTLTGFTPQAKATVYSYGIPQDIAAENAAAPSSGSGLFSSWENSLDGWVNQSGQPDTTATNYGLEAPFLYTTAFGTTGVTDGTTSLACTTTNADPGDSAVIQNSSTTLGTAMSTAASVSLDVYPQVTAGTTVQVSFYINGTNIPYALLGPTTQVTLNANQENTVTFTLTDAQRTGIASSLGGSNYFQVGINIDSPAPLTVYFDNFKITSNAPATPAAPVPGGASSPDLAVSSITNAGTSFSASFGPYSATVISLSPPVVSPVPSGQPVSQKIASGHTVVFSFPNSGSPTPTYQWYLNGSAIPGATSSTLVINGASSADAGTYTATATNPSGSATSSPATLTVVSTNNPGRLINLSARADVGTGGNIIFGGFAIGPLGTPGSQKVLIRGSGPALAQFSVPSLLPDPELQLFSGSTVLDQNAGWGGSATISSTAAAVGAFTWSAPTSHDAALLESLSVGAYTAQVSGQSGDTGNALVEVYDATPSGTYTPSLPRLTNLSARVDVGKGPNALFAGFVIGGSTSVTVLIRASGPAIAAAPYDVPGTLPDPELTLQNPSTQAVYATNNGWGGDSTIINTAKSVGAFGWSSPGSADSALLMTLPPGNYTAEAAGASGDTGVALVEVYEVP